MASNPCLPASGGTTCASLNGDCATMLGRETSACLPVWHACAALQLPGTATFRAIPPYLSLLPR
eukprot:577536-Amphidinium_carterae.1